MDPLTLLALGALVVLARKKRAAAVVEGREIPITITSYWPFDVHTDAERRMEGGEHDRKGRMLHTLQDHIEDPLAHPYVSLAGDYTVFRDGQRLVIPALGEPSEEWQGRTGEAQYVARVVDTGGHFYGPNKVYRNPGHEPIDVCVRTRAESIPMQRATALVVEGDAHVP